MSDAEEAIKKAEAWFRSRPSKEILGYSPAGSIGVTCMFAGLSFTRAYVLRRVFRRLAG